MPGSAGAHHMPCCTPPSPSLHPCGPPLGSRCLRLHHPPFLVPPLLPHVSPMPSVRPWRATSWHQSTVQDLSVHQLTLEEANRRRDALRSAHADEAREEVALKLQAMGARRRGHPRPGPSCPPSGLCRAHNVRPPLRPVPCGCGALRPFLSTRPHRSRRQLREPARSRHWRTRPWPWGGLAGRGPLRRHPAGGHGGPRGVGHSRQARDPARGGQRPRGHPAQRRWVRH